MQPLPRVQRVTMMTTETDQTLLARLSSFPEGKIALRYPRPVSYAELLDRSLRIAKGLTDRGICAGDRVALWLPNHEAWLETCLACAAIGAVALAINPRARTKELGYILNRAEAKAILLTAEDAGVNYIDILRTCDPADVRMLGLVVGVGLARGESLGGPAEVCSLDELAGTDRLADIGELANEPLLIFATSGTTGNPKLVMHRHSSIVAHAINAGRALAMSPTSVTHLAIPLAGVYGFSTALSTLSLGGEVLMRSTWNPEEARRDIRKFGVTNLITSDVALTQLFAASGSGEDFSSVEHVFFAYFNSPSSAIVRQAEQLGMRIVGGYGSSELQALFSARSSDADTDERSKMGGIPVSPLVKVRARDADTGRILADGQTGMLEFYAPESCFMAYLGDPKLTAKAFTADGFFKSGDIGYSESNGSFTYLGRSGDNMRVGGYLVHRSEIERVIETLPGIVQAHVVSVSTPTGERPVAFVRSDGSVPIDEAEIISSLQAMIAKYKVPVKIIALESFPVSVGANGPKILVSELKRMASDLYHGEIGT